MKFSCCGLNRQPHNLAGNDLKCATARTSLNVSSGIAAEVLDFPEIFHVGLMFWRVNTTHWRLNYEVSLEPNFQNQGIFLLLKG